MLGIHIAVSHKLYVNLSYFQVYFSVHLLLLITCVNRCWNEANIILCDSEILYLLFTFHRYLKCKYDFSGGMENGLKKQRNRLLVKKKKLRR